MVSGQLGAVEKISGCAVGGEKTRGLECVKPGFESKFHYLLAI